MRDIVANMCGIAGIIHPSARDREAFPRVLERIIHRGPDDAGTFDSPSFVFGMRRLSIIDIAGGKQPIASKDGNLIIVFNGEIYNYRELRKELEAKGHTITTKSDTEVILHLYEDRGSSAVESLRGMFTICIYDRARGVAFLARDPFGIKPLYYLERGGEIRAFASEIKSLRELPEYSDAVNDDALYNYLSFQYNPLHETFFKGIYRFPPATRVTIDLTTHKATWETYWDYTFKIDEAMEEQAATKRLEEILTDSVAHHLISDVPLGAFLSGGVDSALIVGAIRAVHPTGELKTFTIGSREVNEFAEAREQAEALRTTHTEITLDPDEYLATLPTIAYHFDEPVADPAAVALFFLAREARKHVTVVLSGEGSDELFGGYGIYREPYSFARYTRVPSPMRALLSPLGHIPLAAPGINFLRRYRTALRDRYIGNAYIFSDQEAKQIWKGREHARLRLDRLYERVADLPESSQMQYIDMHMWLPGDILAKADKMTMAHSLELRVPFLDREVAAFAETIPERLRYKEGSVENAKYLLRKASKAFVPPATMHRRKLGFPIPLASWLRTRHTWQKPLLTHPFLSEYVHQEQVEALIDTHMRGGNTARKLFILMMLGAWHDAFLKH
jgi:asparagine synthase (glutamine-hydrolysing)